MIEWMPHEIARPARPGVVHVADNVAIPPGQHLRRHALQLGMPDHDPAPSVCPALELYVGGRYSPQRPEHRPWRRNAWNLQHGATPFPWTTRGQAGGSWSAESTASSLHRHARRL